eukprot:TRINITY_DN73644_c0_g1_i1.p1 TRINITY_DN73644_c0_g1~~TRINITY_DN73644_c0_g1_i1.p1  ORF type:complete len:327 (-),score=40.76 TRINITY_DN73644_c0_g1_i1:51-896(-)
MEPSPRPPVGPYSGAPPPITSQPLQLNEAGLPIRPGRERCLLYLNTGSCKNGVDCIFDHPPGKPPVVPPVLATTLPLPPATSPAMASTAPSSDNGDASPGPGSSAVQQPKESSTATSSAALESGSAPDGNSGSAAADPAAPAQEGEKVAEVEYNDVGLPIRPGMQKCGFYLKSGACSYGPTCRFDHPAGLGGIMAGPAGIGSFPLLVGGAAAGEPGLARRPGKAQCPFLARTGECPFGPECRFDHAPGEHGTGGFERRSYEPRKKDKGLGGVKGRRPPRRM